ncbi:hypothetical protein ACHAXN_001214 [Cyclotella atomus]
MEAGQEKTQLVHIQQQQHQGNSDSTAFSSLRFVRFNPRFDRQETLDLLQSELKAAHQDCRFPIQVPWLLSPKHQLEFFGIPADISLNKMSSFQLGRVYGMDVTSGAAVAALLLDIYDQNTDGSDEKPDQSRSQKESLRVLDLCCAPGLKLCMIADLVHSNSSLVGVDVSKQRLSLCKNIIQKYHIDNTTSGMNLSENAEEVKARKRRVNIQLYCGDGTTYNGEQSAASELVFDSTSAIEELLTRGKRKRMNKSARAREKRRLLELGSKLPNPHNASSNKSNVYETEQLCHFESNIQIDSVDEKLATATTQTLFDRVLVDAECSSDGAIRHIQKRQSSTVLKEAAWTDSNLDELIDLQKRLIDSGYRLLESGGILVYSTCSLSKRQNEEVVNWLLNKYNESFIIPVSFGDSSELEFIQVGGIPGTVRFNPFVSRDEPINSNEHSMLAGGGFFLAKLGKMRRNDSLD